jgi:hypothetical protein
MGLIEGHLGKLVAAVLFLFAEGLPAANATTVDDGELAVCARVQSPPSRLACYDRLLAPPAAQQDVEWRIVKDSKGITLRLLASRNSKARTPVQLTVRCQPSKAELFINWGEWLVSEGGFPERWKYVTIQVADVPAERQKWALSDDNRATILPNHPLDFFKKIAAAGRFVVEATPYREHPIAVIEAPITAEFEVYGLKAVLPFLVTACK